MSDTQNQNECVKSMGSLGIELFKVSMACFLSIFVPQRCGSETCAVVDFADPFRTTVLGMNFFTFIGCMYAYLVECQREKYIIHNFDTSDDIADAGLVIHDPAISSSLKRHNVRFLRTTSVVSLAMFLNIAVSIVFLAFHYDGATTLTSGLSYVLVVVTMLFDNYTVAKKSVNEHAAISSVAKEFVSYNIVEKK